MRYPRPYRLAAHGGFTLIETIMVMAVLGIAAAGIASLTSGIFKGDTDNKNMQVGVQMMQECAELVLSTRRTSGFNAAANASCSGITLSGFSAPTFTTATGNSTSANMGACPLSTGNNCMLVSVTQGGLTPITLMLVNY